MLSIFNAAQVIGFYGFNSWLPTLLTARGINLTHGLEYAFIIAIAQPVGPLLGTLFADRIERKTQILAGLACMGAAMAAFAIATSPAALIALGIVFTLAANVMSYAYHGYQAELFPTRIRSRAVGFVVLLEPPGGGLCRAARRVSARRRGRARGRRFHRRRDGRRHRRRSGSSVPPPGAWRSSN